MGDHRQEAPVAEPFVVGNSFVTMPTSLNLGNPY